MDPASVICKEKRNSNIRHREAKVYSKISYKIKKHI